MGRKRIEARIKKEAVETVKSGKLTQREASRRLGISLIIAPNPAASSLPGKNFEKKRNSSALVALFDGMSFRITLLFLVFRR